MDNQLRLGLPDPRTSPQGALRVWLMAADQREYLPDRRYFFIDSNRATPATAPGDIALLRFGDDHYTVLGPEETPRSVRQELLEHLCALLGSPDLKLRRTTAVRDVLAISPAPGRFRGALAGGVDDIRSRTPFEHALLQVAGRHGTDRMPEAMQACRRAQSALDEHVHPAVRGIFWREHADMLAEIFEQTGDTEYALAAAPAYDRAAREFGLSGLQYQRRISRIHGVSIKGMVQPWLDGFPRMERPPSSTLGYAVYRLCGFGLTLDVPGALWLARHLAGAFVPFGSIALSDREIVQLLCGTASPHRRVVAAARDEGSRVALRVGLHDEMRAILGDAEGRGWQDDVSAIVVSCGSLTFETDPLAIRPREPVTFRAVASGSPHHISVRIAFFDHDDLTLHFKWDRPREAFRTFM